MNVTCVARVLSVYSARGVLLLDEERPQIAPVMGSRDSNKGIYLLNYLYKKFLKIKRIKTEAI